MTLVSKTYWAGMPFWFRKTPEDAVVESLVLRAHDLRQLRANYWTSSRHPAPRVGVVVMHPWVDFTHHYSVPRLIAAGFGVLAANTRHGGNVTIAEQEEMVLDLGACVKHLVEKRGVAKVIVIGNCGGGSLAAYYQAEAERPAAERTKTSPGGAPTFFDGAPLRAADAIVLIAPHRGQGKIVQSCIDPSVTDESDPLSCDPELDMYDPRNGFREPPAPSTYSAEFLARYRAAQAARVARLDARARSLIERAKAADGRGRVVDPIFVVHRTMANPACVDPSIDPSPRDYGALLSERPDLMNYAALGIARTCTPRTWLSMWSGLSSQADLVANIAKVTAPTLVCHAERDREIFPADIAAISGAAAATDLTTTTIAGARHYFEPELGAKTAPHVEALMDVVVPWIQERV